MDANTRREKIKQMLQSRGEPLSASALARELGVSRQVIVGDIALLRAAGCDIIATARGYLLSPAPTSRRFVGKLACRHSGEDTRRELYAMVDMGAEVLDVVVEHELYGQLTGGLNLSTRGDVDRFVERAQTNQSAMLSTLTGGVHLHTVACPDAGVFQRLRQELERLGFLYDGE